MTVKSQLYAKYYFELRALFKNQEEFPLRPLDNYSAQQLEERSNEVEQQEKVKKGEKMSLTSKDIKPYSKGMAIIS